MIIYLTVFNGEVLISNVMNRIYYFLLLLSICLGCSNNYNCFSDNSYLIKDIKATKPASSELFLSEVGGCFQMICIRDYLVITYTKGERLYSIYDKNKVMLNAGGVKGHAYNEFIDIMLNGQKSNEGFWVNDVNGKLLAYIDLNKTIKEGKNYTEKKISTSPRSANAYYCGDSLMIYEQETSDNFILNYINLNDNSTIKTVPLYKPTAHPFQAYFCLSKISPSNDKMVWAMQSINQVNILDLKSEKKISVSPYVAPTEFNPNNERWIYYCDAQVDSKYIYALYMNQSIDDSYNVEKGMELHVINWDGKFICKIDIKEYIVGIAIDEINNYFYGRDINDNIFKYDLNGVIESV